jgi:uncharacterized membrane protein YjjP (DUF1212 family)
MSGGGAGVTGNLIAAAISSVTADAYPELNPIPIALVSVVASLIGGVMFYGLALRVRNPRLAFALVALIVASLASTCVLVVAPAGFAKIAIPTHFVVALVAIAVIPRLALAPRRDGLEGHRLRSERQPSDAARQTPSP